MTPLEVATGMLQEDLESIKESILRYQTELDSLSLRRLQVDLNASIIRIRMIFRMREECSSMGILKLLCTTSKQTDRLSEKESLWDKSLE